MFEAFSVGPAIIWMRLVFLLIAIVLATEFFLRLAQSAHLSLQHFREHAKQFLVSFLVFGRVFAIIGQYQVYRNDPLRMFVFWDGEFSFLGAAIGIGLILWWTTRAHRSTFLQWLDVLLPATIFGLAFEWFGKFASGAAYGKPTDIPWAVTYDTIGVRYTVPIHPVQLYYAFFCLVLTFVLLIIRKSSKRAGAETFMGIFLLSAGTFFFEQFRGDFAIPVFATQMDFIVLIILFISLGIFAALELRLSPVMILIYEAVLVVVFGTYLVTRTWLQLPTFELRLSQFLAILAFLATVVYVIAHRQKYPHL